MYSIKHLKSLNLIEFHFNEGVVKDNAMVALADSIV